LVASAISVAKAASAGENEDAHGVDVDGGYLTVADGASTSFRAAEWAQVLCRTFLAERPLDGVPTEAWISRATRDFLCAAVPAPGDWWGAEAARRGSHAAFAGLAVIDDGQRLTWRAVAVGDCLIVHLHPAADGRLPVVTAFPIAHSASFPSNPYLLSTVAGSLPPVHHLTGPAAVGDTWLLMTDELARWALRRQEAGDPLWRLLADGAEAEVRAAIDAARAGRAVADDDMTLIRCRAVPVLGR
jgi:hypothetical protein